MNKNLTVKEVFTAVAAGIAAAVGLIIVFTLE